MKKSLLFFITCILINQAKTMVNPAYIDSAGLDNYTFIAPERWITQRGNDYILLSQYQSLERGCVIVIVPPQPSSGNLETDARNVFNQMYMGWTYQPGINQEDISKGYTAQGLEYCRIEARMQKSRGDGYYFDYESGDALVIKLGNKVAIIGSRPNRGEMVCFCKYQYEYWGRFFNSFQIKRVSAQENKTDMAKRMIGKWQSIGGSALVSYVFAANSRYQFIGAYSTTSRIDRYTIETRTSAFKGDGSYQLNGIHLVFKKDGQVPETSTFHLEQVKHGSSAWTDRLYILETSKIDGKEYEVCYEKQD